MNESCTCEYCVKCCERVPGGFSPNTLRRFAVAMEVTDVRRLFDGLLAWKVFYLSGTEEGEWEDGHDVLVPIPRAMNQCGGERDLSRGHAVVWGGTGWPCSQLQDGRCLIHTVKPWECRQTVCRTMEDAGIPQTGDLLRRLARAWDRPAAKQFGNFLREDDTQ